MGSVFRFKQFEVDQRDCAMKINTDGVLLGAVVEGEQASHILDIGTGTGVISLMLAQRFGDAVIEAVEIDEAAYLRADANFKSSKFADRLSIFYNSFEDISSSTIYDLIVSNPPFYTNSLHNPDEKKKLARHTDQDFFLKLLNFSWARLTDRGSLQLILPTELAKEVVDMAFKIGFSLSRVLDVRSFEESESIRQIITLRKNMAAVDLIKADIIIYKSKGEYTEAYKRILSPFFLAY